MPPPDAREIIIIQDPIHFMRNARDGNQFVTVFGELATRVIVSDLFPHREGIDERTRRSIEYAASITLANKQPIQSRIQLL